MHKHPLKLKFHFKENCLVIVCDKVLKGAPVLRVHYGGIWTKGKAKGMHDWQLLCGEGEHSGNGEQATLVCLKCMVERDSTLNLLSQMKAGQTALRLTIEDEWTIRSEDDVDN